MLIVVVVCLIGGYVAIIATDAVYRSETSILIEGRTPNTPGNNINDPVSEVTMPTSDRDILTQIQVLTSSKLTIDAYQAIGLSLPPGPLSKETLEQLLPRVQVEQAGTTNVINISVESTNPDTALQLARTIPTIYLDYVSRSRQGEVDNALTFLTKRLEEEREALRIAEADLETFKQSRSLLPLENEGDARSKSVSQAESELASAQANVAAARERLNALVAAKAALPQTLHTPTEQANTQQKVAQQNAIADLRAKREALAAKFMPDHPEVKALDAQIAAMEDYLKSIPDVADASTTTRHPDILWFDEKIADARAVLKGAEAQQNRTQATVNGLQQTLRAYNAVAPKQNELERNVDERKTSIDSINKALEELRVRRNSVRDPVTILTPATAAAKVRPRFVQYMGVAALTGLFLAIAFSLMRESLDDRIYSGAEVLELTGLRSLSELPDASPEALVMRDGPRRERQLEPYRLLRYNLLLAAADSKSITITSSIQGEGKTGVASNLAIALAESGRRVVLVDADLASPIVAREFQAEPSPGLVELIHGKTQIPECLQATRVENLMVLASGTRNSKPVVLTPDGILKIQDTLLQHADIVLYDAPSLKGSADARLFVGLTDSVLVVASIGRTTRAALASAVDELRESNARVLGVALTGAGETPI